MHDRGGIISTGTAFNYECNGTRFLVTNWHNISGKDFFTRASLQSNARMPMWIEASAATWVDGPEVDPRAFAVLPRRIELYADGDAMLDPLWIEHPQLGNEGCDVIAISDPKPAAEPEFMHNSVNKISLQRIPVKPGEVAFVIGYPEGLKVGFGLPIWKSTFIASEPHYDVTIKGQRLPAFFLDGYTRPGMSGSPVFALFRGSWNMKSPYENVDFSAPGFWQRDDIAIYGSSGIEFVGIYSGRLPTKEGQAALGLCWRKQLIDEICSTQFDQKATPASEGGVASITPST
jgi:hypothetical protein